MFMRNKGKLLSALFVFIFAVMLFAMPVYANGTTTVTITLPFKITFDLNGKAGTAPESQSIASGEKVTKPADPTAEGLRFLGWCTDRAGEELYDFDTPVKSNFTLYARWIDEEVKTYTVRFDLNGHGNKAPSAQIVEENGNAKPPLEPSEQGWLFKGWYRDKECKTLYDFSDSVTADITLYACWLRSRS